MYVLYRQCLQTYLWRIVHPSVRCDSLHRGFVKLIACTVASVWLDIGRMWTGVSSFQTGCTGLHRRAAVTVLYFFLTTGTPLRDFIHLIK